MMQAPATANVNMSDALRILQSKVYLKWQSFKNRVLAVISLTWSYIVVIQ